MQEPSRGDGGAGGKYPSLLEDFQTGTASMARKRHLASSARGFSCFCLMAQIGVQEVQEVQIRPIRLIRGKTEEPILWRTALQAAFVVRPESEGVAPGYSR